MKNSKVILFVNAIRPATFAALEKHFENTGQRLIPYVFVNSHIEDRVITRNGQLNHKSKAKFISADINNSASVIDALSKIEGKVIALVSQYENSMDEYKKLIPYFPNLYLPTSESIDWATEKKLMREKLEEYNKNLVPKFLKIHNNSLKTILEVEKNIEYPLIIKPSGLEGSLLVSLVRDRKELKTSLAKGFELIQHAYDFWIKRQKPFFLAEEFMDGDMYSVDCYVDRFGEVNHTPLVRVITGHSVGFDDFFGYMRITPSDISKEDVKLAKKAAEDACKALNLKSLTAHVELMHTATGWKIIELGPRIGGYRHEMYGQSYGINHIMNDILNRAGEKPIIPDKLLGYSAMFNIHAREEGIFESFSGDDIVKLLESFVNIKQRYEIGEKLLFARHNGDPVFDIMLFNSDKEILLKDIHKMEKALKINVATQKQKALATNNK